MPTAILRKAQESFQKTIGSVLATGFLALFAGIFWELGMPLLQVAAQLVQKTLLLRIIMALLILLLLCISWALILRYRLRESQKKHYGFDSIYGCLIDLQTKRKLCPKCRHPLIDMGNLLKCVACNNVLLKLAAPPPL